MIVTASCPTIMLTASSCQSQPITSSSSCSWEMWAIGNAWTHGWKDSRAQTPVFPVKCCLWSPLEGLCFRGCTPRSGKWSTKCAQDCRESSVWHKTCKKTAGVRPLFEDGGKIIDMFPATRWACFEGKGGVTGALAPWGPSFHRRFPARWNVLHPRRIPSHTKTLH